MSRPSARIGEGRLADTLAPFAVHVYELTRP